MATTLTAADGIGQASVDVIADPDSIGGYLVTVTTMAPAGAPFGVQVNGSVKWQDVATPGDQG